MMMYLGRIFNLIAYVAISFAALKIVPIKKKLFFLLALLPMSIIHAASLSADGITNSSALLFAAYILYLAYGNVKTISKKHIMIAIAIGIFIALCKNCLFSNSSIVFNHSRLGNLKIKKVIGLTLLLLWQDVHYLLFFGIC